MAHRTDAHKYGLAQKNIMYRVKKIVIKRHKSQLGLPEKHSSNKLQQYGDL